MKPHELVDQKIELIQVRNALVEAEKAWEISLTRRAIIALGTYIIIGGYLMILGIKNPWLHALVPVFAYIISSLSLPLLKRLWIKSIYTNKS